MLSWQQLLIGPSSRQLLRLLSSLPEVELPLPSSAQPTSSQLLTFQPELSRLLASLPLSEHLHQLS